MVPRHRLAALFAASLIITAVSPAVASPVERSTFIVTVAPARIASAEARAAALGGQIGFRYRAALTGFSVSLPAQAAEALQAAPGVLDVEQDRLFTTADTQTGATWGIDRIDQRALPLSTTFAYPSVAGAGVRAYVIDTGILASHGDFGGRVDTALGFSAVADGLGTADCNGHGTHVAGTIGGATYGVAKAVTLVPVRVMNCNGGGSTSGVIAGVDFVTAAKSASPSVPMVANMSLGGGASSTLDRAVSQAVAAGVVMAVAAGNSNVDACTTSPARAGAVLTVGATTSNDVRSSYSNFGSCLDIFAPGSGILSTWHTSPTASNTISGTSMATPHVTGAAALYLGITPGASASATMDALTSNATPDRVSNAGLGSVNRLLYSGFLNAAPTTAPVPAPAPAPAPEPAPAPAPAPAPSTSVPGIPQALAATPGSRSLTASWLVPTSDGGSAITGYTVQLWNGSALLRTWVDVTAMSLRISGLSKNKIYYVKVAAVNARGTGAYATSSVVDPF